MSKSDTLTLKQENFAQYFAIHDKQIDAYKAAYNASNMSDNAIYVEASRLLDNPKIALRVQEIRASMRQRHQIDQDWITDKLVTNIERAMQETPVLGKDGEPTGIYQYNGAVANKSLELLARIHGVLIDRSESKSVHLQLEGSLDVLRDLPPGELLSIIEAARAGQQQLPQPLDTEDA